MDYFGKHAELVQVMENAEMNGYLQTQNIDAWFDQFAQWVERNAALSNVSGLIDDSKCACTV